MKSSVTLHVFDLQEEAIIEGIPNVVSDKQEQLVALTIRDPMTHQSVTFLMTHEQRKRMIAVLEKIA